VGWDLFLLLVIIIPVLLFPAAFMWFMDLGAIVRAVKTFREHGVTRGKAV
jgi:hypothetical protein